MKKYRGLIILAVVAAALIGIYFWMETTDNAAISGSLYRMDEDETITGISINNVYGLYEFSLDQEGRWNVTTDGNTYRTHTNKMDLILSALKNISISRVLDEEIPDYGLEKPQSIVTCTTSKGDTHCFAIGNETVSKAEVYIRNQENGKVMVTSTGAVAQFTGSLSAYRDKEVFTIDKNNIVSVEYYKDGEKQLAVDRTGGSWKLTYPFEAPARQIIMNEFISDWVKWTAAGFPQEGSEDYAGMGLENSATWLDFVDANGKTQRLQIGSNQGTGTYVRTGDRDEVAVMYTTDLDFSKFTPDALVFVSPLKATADQLASITVQTAAGTDTFVVEQLDGGKQKVTLNGAEIHSNDFASIFSKYIGMNADGYAPGDAGNSVVAVLTSTYVDGSKAQLILQPRDESTFYMLVDGSTDFYINANELEELLYRINSVKAAQ
ncbi:MAG: DUF4340 domain-containing protein [Oscillospiraceae bacterium]|nr:DUF4340 domain-containing protein [Oscillospiraceae bacterium]